MPKRRTGVNNIIFELDEHDTGSDSDGDVVHVAPMRARSKRNRGAAVRAAAQRLASIKKAHAVDADCVEVIDLESTDLDNVGANSSVVNLQSNDSPHTRGPNEETDIVDSCLNISDLPDPNLSANILDSVDSDDEGQTVVAGCHRETPLITVKFRDKRLAKQYKAEVKKLLVSMLSWQPINDEEMGDDTDVEIFVWPNDVEKETDIDKHLQGKENDLSLFFVDTNPNNVNNEKLDIPQYCQTGELLKDNPVENVPPKASRVQCCFNCDGDHLLHQCPLPKNYARINQSRKAMNTVKMGRYHAEDEQKYGHLVPGRISGKLRHALGLKRHELPLHIYRMRLLGYPPGWLQEARIQHSGISMFDSQGQAIQDPDEGEELCTPGSKDKFDIKKILDYPGFNVAASSRYKEIAHNFGLPPMSERDSKMLMLATLAPNAMQAYKRRKLTMFPSTANGDSSIQAGTADMDIASDGETSVEFPSVPPLPDEAPPSAPPPPPPPPVPKEPAPPCPKEPEPPSSPNDEDTSTTEGENSQSTDEKRKSKSSSGRSSPSLTDLEEHKRMLLEALQSSVVQDQVVQDDDPGVENTEQQKDKPENNATPKRKTVSPGCSTPKLGQVKHSDYGTPVVNVASPYVKLPSDDKFAKDICDIINFENLPDSTGAYKKMSALLRRVKDEVTKIQDT